MSAKNLNELEQEYNHIYSRPDELMSAEEVERSLDGPWHKTLRKKLEPLAGKKVLEIACGQGALCFWLNTQQAEVWSSDFSKEAVEQTKALIQHHFDEPTAQRITLADMQNLPFDDNSFDVFISCETLEHIPDPDLALAEVYRVLKPGGRFYLTTENYLNFTGLYRLLEEKVRKKQWCSGSFIQPIEHFFTTFSVLNDLKKHGFQIKHTDSTGHYLYFPRQPLPFNLTWLSSPVLKPLFKIFGRHLFILSDVKK